MSNAHALGLKDLGVKERAPEKRELDPTNDDDDSATKMKHELFRYCQ